MSAGGKDPVSIFILLSVEYETPQPKDCYLKNSKIGFIRQENIVLLSIQISKSHQTVVRQSFIRLKHDGRSKKWWGGGGLN